MRQGFLIAHCLAFYQPPNSPEMPNPHEASFRRLALRRRTSARMRWYSRYALRRFAKEEALGLSFAREAWNADDQLEILRNPGLGAFEAG